MYSSLKDGGRAAIVLDTGAVSRGSGTQGTNKEKEVRSKFVDNDLIEGVLLLPENLFYNTTAPGIVLFLNLSKPKERRRKILLVNASQEFEKGRPKNFIPPAGIKRVSSTFLNWTEEEKFSKVITIDDAVKNDYNLSPSRYIETAETVIHRSVGHILYDLEQAEKDAVRVDKELVAIFSKLGLKAEAYDA
jgi:type I restriction enzyme M protein